MAIRTTVSTNETSQYELDVSNHTWIFSEGHLFSGSPVSIHQDSTLANDTIIVNGHVDDRGSNGVGIGFEGSDSTIIISKTGAVVADEAVEADGNGMLVRNDGLVNSIGLAAGIYVGGANAHVVNNGEVFGAAGIDIGSAGGLVENNGSIHAYYTGIEFEAGGVTAILGRDSIITANSQGIEIDSSVGQKSTVTNNGLIAMNGDNAFDCKDGNETLINHGTVHGDVQLGAGNDVFNNLDGKLSGDIYGGIGDDTFIVNAAKTQIYENTGEGSDLVKLTISFSLNTNALAASEIENLTLLGSKNINATGNDWANTIKGNRGDNIIDGGLQNDALTGGKGHDTFVFATNDNVDEMLDFRPGVDKIDLSGVVDIQSFKDMLKNHVSESGGAVHIASGADELVLDHTSKTDLHATDFIF